MTFTDADKRSQRWVLFVVGVAFLTKFAIWTPTLLNPYMTALIGGCLFGPAVFGLWKGKDDE